MTDDDKTLDARVYGTPHSGPNVIADPDAEIVVYPVDQRYELRKALGEGGMGEVRLVGDRVLGRDVAMKVVLDAHRARPEMRARFEREARVQGQLEHPAIVPVYDFGRDAEGRAFFTMQRVRGTTLDGMLDAIRKGDDGAAREHPRHKLLAAFVRVCLAVQYASEHGVVHRDLKPGNVMLGRHGEVYVLDWGLAKVTGAIEPASPSDAAETPPPSSRKGISGASGSATLAGAMLGTPQFMSPEQVRGEELDNRSDIYALGAILFEILTLEPLHGEGPVAVMLQRVLDGVEARASVRAPARDVPPELEAACVCATALHRRDRFANARALGDVVDAYLSGDRDLELRRTLAKVHFARAREAAARAEVPGAAPSERAEALRETGRTIALAPDDAEATAFLVALLTRPPEIAPPEVVELVEREDAKTRTNTLPGVALAFAATAIVATSFQVLLGVKSALLVAIPFALWLIAAASTYVGYRYRRDPRGYYPQVTVFSGLALGATTLIHGPSLVVPALAAALAMGAALTANKRTRPFATSSFAAAVALPLVATWLGWHPSGLVFTGDGVATTSAAVHMPQTATLAFLLAMYLAIVVVGARYAGDYHDELHAAKLRNELQAWQLRQLVPDEAARAMGRLPEPDRAATRGA